MIIPPFFTPYISTGSSTFKMRPAFLLYLTRCYSVTLYNLPHFHSANPVPFLFGYPYFLLLPTNSPTILLSIYFPTTTLTTTLQIIIL